MQSKAGEIFTWCFPAKYLFVVMNLLLKYNNADYKADQAFPWCIERYTYIWEQYKLLMFLRALYEWGFICLMSETRPERFLFSAEEQTAVFSALVQEMVYFFLNQWRIQDFSEGR